MDTFEYFRIHNYRIDIFDGINDTIVKDDAIYEDVTWVPCTVNPICHPTVKGLMVDHINHYIYSPLCNVLDLGLNISEKMLFLTPNLISASHVIVAIVGARLLISQTLAIRRLAVLLFQFRMFLDDLDGHIARERKHIKGERSEVGSLGYWIDGICDLIGVIAMMTGVFLYFKSNPPRRGYKNTPANVLPYHQLKEINTNDDVEKDVNSEVGISYKTKVAYNKIVQVLGLFSGQMVLSSLAWNRYIDLYQEILENNTGLDVLKREALFKSDMFFSGTAMWRIVNPHSYLHLLSLAIYYDKTWLFLKTVHFVGFLALIVAVCVTEYFVIVMAQNITSDNPKGL